MAQIVNESLFCAGLTGCRKAGRHPGKLLVARALGQDGAQSDARIAQGGNFPLAGFKFVKRNKAAVGACGIVRHLADA